MIISHKYKFIFIKTKKTAGTSIEVFLSQLCGDGDVVTPIRPQVEPHVARNYRALWNPLPEIVDSSGRRSPSAIKNLLQGKKYFNHIPAHVVRSRTPGKIWHDYFKFCVERNPWDKTLSHYHMINDRAGGNMTFDDYLDEGRFCINYPFYTGRHGNVIVDEVIKYETLMQDLTRVFAELEIPFTGSLGGRAKSEHRKDRRPYQQVFTDMQRRRIEVAFAREIEMHEYVY